MSDAESKDEQPAVLPDEEVAAVDDTTKPTTEAAEETGSGKKPFIVYYNALSRVVMAACLIAAGVYTIPNVFLQSPQKDFTLCGK